MVKFAAALAAVTVVVVIALVVVLATRDDLAATVRFDAGAPVLDLRLDEDDGTVVTMGQRRGLVHRGRTQLPLDPATLAIGSNTFRVHVGGESETVTADVPLVAYLDTEALVADPPMLGVVVRTQPFSVVSVDGQTVAADATGTARAASPARLDGGLDEHVANVIAHVGGVTHHLRIHLQAQAAALDLRQPPDGFVTDRSSVDLVADVEPTAQVLVDGREVAHEGRRVRAALGLARVGDFRFRVDVIEPHRRRRVETFSVRRVEDLRVAAEAYPTVEGVTYDALVQAPTSGAREAVKLGGVVRHVRIEAGRSYVEVAVEPCALGGGCLLWVQYPAATVAHVDDHVIARGFLRGTAEYRTVGSDVRTAPTLEAVFLTVEPR